MCGIPKLYCLESETDLVWKLWGFKSLSQEVRKYLLSSDFVNVYE
jgi:hypothetical protein